MVRLDNKVYEYCIPQDVNKLNIDGVDYTINNRRIQELEMRIECLENKLKTEQQQQSKYIIVLGE